VTQLINALDGEGHVVPFDAELELLVSAISSQAAISITNMQYAEQITALLDSLVGALSTAIDQRSPYNANHTRNMVRLGEAFLDWLNDTNNPWKFEPAARRSFLMSVWLHDVGKLVVPLEVMDKQGRLGAALGEVEERFTRMGLLDRIAALEGRIRPEELEKNNAERAETLAFIRRINTAGFLPDADLQAVDALEERRFTDETGACVPWLTAEELHCLRVRKGTLTAEERSIMESHVVVTGRILDQVTFPKLYAQVPQWAAGHHELLNGKGYPNHILGRDADGQDLKDADGHKNIPDEVRLLTILDVFDALTARDRPYKPAMPVERALSILHSMVDEGAMDNSILELFEASRAWEEPQ
jgi:HD-GYP domain-containing protein (c-di-GMP phosphodiesterase class II)